MRIVHVSPYYAPAFAYGGVVRAVTGLATAQAAAGHHVTVLTTDTLSPTRRSQTYLEMIDGVTVRRFPNRAPDLRQVNLSTPVGMGNAAATIMADVIHCHELRTVENLVVYPRINRSLRLYYHHTERYHMELADLLSNEPGIG